VLPGSPAPAAVVLRRESVVLALVISGWDSDGMGGMQQNVLGSAVRLLADWERHL
jgi:hypothetical protein